MNRLRKILTLGLEKKRAWQLPLIAGLLALFGLGVRWWFNSRAAKGVRLLDMVDINDIEGVRWICRWDREQVNEEGEVTEARKYERRLVTWKSSPLLLAARKGHTEIAKLLIKAGSHTNAKNKTGWTPLHIAAGYGRTEATKLLIEGRAEANAKDKDGWTPLHIAAWLGHIETVKVLVEARANIEAKGGNDWTPLHVATYHGRIRVVKVLIESGANINAKNAKSDTPLDYAKHRRYRTDPKKQAECAQLLRKHGAKTGKELDAEAKQGEPER